MIHHGRIPLRGSVPIRPYLALTPPLCPRGRVQPQSSQNHCLQQADGLKILKCFPQCNATRGHKLQGSCGEDFILIALLSGPEANATATGASPTLKVVSPVSAGLLAALLERPTSVRGRMWGGPSRRVRGSARGPDAHSAA